MLTSAFLLLLNSTLLSLRLDPRSGSFPRPLTTAEERDCLARWAEGDLAARNTLIEHNLRLVAHIVKKYYVPESDQDDLISIGTIGLIKGISTYRSDKGVRLATYASRCIENEVLMHFRSRKKSAGETSLSEAIDSDGDGSELSLLDTLCDESDMAEELSDRELCSALPKLVAEALTPRERKILTLRYGLGGGTPLTQRRTAELCGISRSYVSRIEKKALEKLKNILDED